MIHAGRDSDRRGRRTRLLPGSRFLCCWQGWWGVILVGVMAGAMGFPTGGWSQEIAPFRLAGVEGFLSLRALFNEDRSRRDASGAEADSRQRQRTFEEEMNLLTHSYIYHPNFVKLDLGGGVVFAQERFETDSQQRASRDAFYNATARLSILERKPYPLVLFFDRVTSPVSSGVAERFLLKDIKYGMHFSLLEPLMPVPLSLEGFRQTQKGEGTAQVTDESIDHLTVRASKSFPQRRGNAALLYQFNRRDSASGNPQFRIAETRSTTHLVNLTSWAGFGSRQQVRLQNVFFFFTQLEFPRRQDIQINPALQWRLTDALDWSVRYNLRRSSVEGINTTAQGARMSLTHRLYESLFTSVDLHGDETRTVGLRDRTYGGGGTISYRKKTFFGRLALQYAAVYEIKHRRSTAAEIPVFGESHVLTGFLPVELNNDAVLLSTVVVFNATRSRTFTEGVDYRLTVVGSKTRMQRLLGGDIQDGETVLVDYSFTTPGVFTYSIFNQQYGVNLTFFSYLTLFARFHEVPQRLLSGVPSQPLNSVHSRLYGFQSAVPIGRFVVGADGEYENHREDISSFRRLSFSAFVQIPLPASTTFQVRGRRVLVDNLESPEDVDLVSVIARLESRPWTRARLSAETRYERDTGATLRREVWFGVLRAEWRIGRLSLRAEGRFSREQQGDLNRDRITGRMEIRREF